MIYASLSDSGRPLAVRRLLHGVRVTARVCAMSPERRRVAARREQAKF